jgi:hypothetical protein
MLTLRRFRALADSYGGDLQRWPQEERDAAQALLNISPQAHALLDEARALDHVIAEAGRRSNAMAQRIGEDDGAAMARLRSGVAARIAISVQEQHPARRHFVRASSGRMNGVTATHFTWIGLTAASSLVVTAGFLIGALYAPEPPSDAVLGMLQPIHILAE